MIQTIRRADEYAKRIRKHYCPFVQENTDRCRLPCSANAFCVENLRKALEIKDARDPLAVFVWRLRDLRAQLRDEIEQAKRTTSSTDWTGRPVDSDPFQALAEQLNIS